MKKLFQNKFFLKSIQVFLVCLVVEGGVETRNVSAGLECSAGFGDCDRTCERVLAVIF